VREPGPRRPRQGRAREPELRADREPPGIGGVARSADRRCPGAGPPYLRRRVRAPGGDCRMVTMTGELAGTKAAPPRHDYRSVILKRGRTQKVRGIILALLSPKKPLPQTPTVTRTGRDTLKVSGRTQKAPGSKEVGGTAALPEEAVLMNLQD